MILLIYIYDFTVNKSNLGYIVLSSSTLMLVLVSVTNSGAEGNSAVLSSRPSPEPTSLGITRRPASVTDLTMLFFSLANPIFFICLTQFNQNRITRISIKAPMPIKNQTHTEMFPESSGKIEFQESSFFMRPSIGMLSKDFKCLGNEVTLKLGNFDVRGFHKLISEMLKTAVISSNGS